MRSGGGRAYVIGSLEQYLVRVKGELEGYLVGNKIRFGLLVSRVSTSSRSTREKAALIHYYAWQYLFGIFVYIQH